MGRYARERVLDRMADLAVQGLDASTFFAEAGQLLQSAVPTSGTPAWSTIDPASLLITSYLDADDPEVNCQLANFEYLIGDTPGPVTTAARSPTGVMTLAELVRRDPIRARYIDRYLVPYGVQELVFVALRTRAGATWGSLDLWRSPRRPSFDGGELAFLQAVASHLAEGTRRGLLIGEATDPEGPEAPGLIVLDRQLGVESLTPGVERWLAELPGRWEADGNLPTAVAAVAARALRSAEGDAPGEVALARVLTRGGRWVALHGASLVTSGARRVAVIVEPAHPARIAALLMAAYGLTDREQEVTRHVLRGDSTTEIAEALSVSPHTVQQHLKSIFDKAGVRSRRELVGRLYVSHYEPRVQDNQERLITSRPIRGGPWPVTN